MSDPFSVAAGAVGVISLGIQLCKEISSYTEAWQGYDIDIESIGLKAESLKTPLKRLRDLVEDTRLTDPEIANDINEKALGLENQVKRLEKKLNQIKPVFSDKPTDKFRNKLKKAAYPVISRDALRDIHSNLDSMQSTIQMTLAIFNAQQAQKSQATQAKMVQLIEEIHLTMSRVSSKSMPAPGLLRSFCDRYGDDAQLAHQQSHTNSINQTNLCNLHSNQAWPVSFHPYKQKLTAKTVKRSYQYHSTWLRHTIKFSFWLSTGAGGFSIAPALKIHAVLDEYSWTKLELCGRANSLGILLLRRNADDIIHDFQDAFSTGLLRPSDMLESAEASFSLVDIFPFFLRMEVGSMLYKFALFLVNCGSMPDNNTEYGFLHQMCSLKTWGVDEYTFAEQMINLGGPLSPMPWTKAGKRNMRGLLDRDNELIDIPEIAKIILRESETDLRKALETGCASPNDRIQHATLLELAVGWPAGVSILLEFGADASEFSPKNSTYRPHDTDDADYENYCNSMMPLLQAGCKLDFSDVLRCRSPRIRSLFIQEIATRRQKLQALAQSCLPSQRLAEVLGGDSKEGILDFHASEICTELLTRGWKVDRSLQPSAHSQSLYHEWNEHIEPWEELYQIGFRDIDVPDTNGFTPLMEQLWYFRGLGISPNGNLEHIIWLVDKGASLSRLLPYSKATVAHLASWWVTLTILRVISQDEYDGLSRFPALNARIIQYKDTILLIPSVHDHCVCSCCLGGCTTFSVALRTLIKQRGGTNPPMRETKRLFHQAFDLLLRWANSRPGIYHAIIRSLTHHALSLRHTCCDWIGVMFPFQSEGTIAEEEIDNIREEDQHLYDELEKLISEFEKKFNQLGLPITEFLDNYWHARMIEYLSTPGTYDDEHIQQTRNLGILLEPHEIDIPDIVYYFGNQVDEVTSD